MDKWAKNEMTFQRENAFIWIPEPNRNIRSEIKTYVRPFNNFCCVLNSVKYWE